MRTWPDEGVTRIPYWVYSDPEVYEREQRRVFGGPFWSYVALGVSRAARRLHVDLDRGATRRRRAPTRWLRARVLNRCAHRGVAFCRSSSGHADELMCPYHQWVYDLAGNLVAAPFRKGVTGSGGHRMGGMPDDFELADHGLVSLPVIERHGVVFASIGSTAAVRRIPRPDDARLVRPRLRRTRPRAARLHAPAGSRELEAHVREHQGPVSRLAAARVPRDVRAVPGRQPVGHRDGRDRTAQRAGLRARRGGAPRRPARCGPSAT